MFLNNSQIACLPFKRRYYGLSVRNLQLLLLQNLNIVVRMLCYSDVTTPPHPAYLLTYEGTYQAGIENSYIYYLKKKLPSLNKAEAQPGTCS